MTPSRYPGIIGAILQYPAIILVFVSVAYAFLTPSTYTQADKRQLKAKYACTHSNPPDWCRELASDLAEGRRNRQQPNQLARIKRACVQTTIPITTHSTKSKETP